MEPCDKPLKRAPTPYHGTHEYSTFSNSVISTANKEDDDDDGNDSCTARCCLLCRLHQTLILHPIGPFRCLWDVFVMILLIYTSAEIPYTFAFGHGRDIQFIGLGIDALLLLDILLNFHTAYFDKYDNLRLVTNKRHICKKYFRSWFFVDLLTCIPFELIIAALDDHDESTTTSDAFAYIKFLRIFRLFRIIKILRFLKMLRIFDAFMKQLITREIVFFIRLVKIIFGMLMFAHFAGCLWWYVGLKTSPSWIDAQGIRDNAELTDAQKYSYAWYWAVVTLFTTGYGDIVATNMVEQWVSSICILIGTCFFAYFVGTLTVLITEGDKIKSYELEKLEEAQSFCEKKKLPKELARAILTHIRYHCNYNYVFDESEILSLLPSYLQHDINTYVAKRFLAALPMFHHLPNFIVGLIAVKTKSVSCNQNYKLYDKGDMAKEFYIQRTGKSIMYDGHGKLMHELVRGSVAGEYSSILFKRRRGTLKCVTWSEYYCLSVDDIRDVLYKYYPKSALSKWKKIKAYTKRAYAQKIRHSVELNNYNDSTYNLPLYTGPLPTSQQHRQGSPSLNSAQNLYEESVHVLDNEMSKRRRSSRAQVRTRDGEKGGKEGGTADVANGHGHSSDDIIVVTADNLEAVASLSTIASPTLRSRASTKRTSNASTTVGAPARASTPRITTFSRFKFRSNSELRNFVVMAHAEKHNKLSTPKSPKTVSSHKKAFKSMANIWDTKKADGKQHNSSPNLQRYNTAPALKTPPPDLFMDVIPKSKTEVLTSMLVDPVEQLMKSLSMHSRITSDSECSFASSVADTDWSDDQAMHRAMSSSTKKQAAANTRVKKKGKGKFGARSKGRKLNVKQSDAAHLHRNVVRLRSKHNSPPPPPHNHKNIVYPHAGDDDDYDLDDEKYVDEADSNEETVIPQPMMGGIRQHSGASVELSELLSPLNNRVPPKRPLPPNERAAANEPRYSESLQSKVSKLAGINIHMHNISADGFVVTSEYDNDHLHHDGNEDVNDRGFVTPMFMPVIQSNSKYESSQDPNDPPAENEREDEDVDVQY